MGMVMNLPKSPEAIGKIELNWQRVAYRLSAKVPTLYFDAGARFNDATDEFLVRQLLREILIDTLSESFVTLKEQPYPNARKRIDLTLGPPKEAHDTAIEIKSDGATPGQIKEDWSKLLKCAHPIRLSIFSGVVEQPRHTALEKEFSRKLFTIEENSSVHEIACPAFRFTIDELQGKEKKDLVAFCWIWSIGKDARSLPKIDFPIVRG